MLSTFSHISSVGLVANAGLQAAGENGTAYGAVYYAVEVYDATTSHLLYAHVTLQTPDALDITASFGYLDAAREGVRIGAHSSCEKNGKPVPAARDQRAGIDRIYWRNKINPFSGHKIFLFFPGPDGVLAAAGRAIRPCQKSSSAPIPGH